MEEVENGGGLAEDILDASGIDVLNPASPEELALEQYRAVIARAEGSVSEGVASAGGYRGTLAMSGDGVGSAVDQISSLPIDWHDIDDLSGLDSWTPLN